MTGTSTSSTSATPHHRSGPVPRGLGDGAGLLAVSLLVYSVAGAIWGVLRTPIRGTHLGEGAVSLDPTSSAEFSSFITFALGTAVLGAALGAAAYVINRESRGLRMLLWLLVAALAGSASFLAVGDLVGTALHSSVLNPDELVRGEEVVLMPRFSPQIAWLASPFTAALSYWLCLVMSVRQERDEKLVT